MGKFGCAQILEKKTDFCILLVWNVLPSGLIDLVTKMVKKYFDPVFYPPGERFGQKRGYSWELAKVFGSKVPLALLIDP